MTLGNSMKYVASEPHERWVITLDNTIFKLRMKCDY